MSALATLLNFYRRGAVVARYHTQPLIRPQSVGEHSANVALLLTLMLGPAEGRDGMTLLLSEVRISRLMKAALFHDLPESKTGDIPAPVKREGGQELRRLIHAIEARTVGEAGLEPVMLTEQDRRLLKLADCLEGMLYTAEELQRGNSALREVYWNFDAYVRGAIDLETEEPKIELRALEIFAFAAAKAIDTESAQWAERTIDKLRDRIMREDTSIGTSPSESSPTATLKDK